MESARDVRTARADKIQQGVRRAVGCLRRRQTMVGAGSGPPGSSSGVGSVGAIKSTADVASAAGRCGAQRVALVERRVADDQQQLGSGGRDLWTGRLLYAICPVRWSHVTRM